jgi:ubiquinone/menaquinone biosynthesis C-methylase UbiE
MQNFTVSAFKILGEENRLRLLNLLLSKELNVQELTAILGIGQSRVSRHLKQLTDGGFLRSRRDGLWAYYRAAAEGEPRRLLDAVAYLFEEEELYRADRRIAAELLKQGRAADLRFFDSVAPEWERLRLEILGELDLTATIAGTLPELAEGVVTDLGCGSGVLLPVLARKAASVIGVDASERMLLEARRRIQSNAATNVELRLGELEHLPMRDSESDWVVVNLVLHHLRTPLAGLQEAARVIRSGGGLIVVDLEKHRDELMRSRFGDRWLGFSRNELESWLTEAGFRVEEIREFPLRPGLTAVLLRARRTLADLQSDRIE